MAITIEQIHATADSLAQQGIKPTQTNVREALGGGSFTTIAEALRTWRAEQDTTEQLAQVVLPQEIAERSHTLTAQIWETAQQLANDRLVKEREAMEHKEALMREEVEEAQHIVKTLEGEQGELLAQLDDLTAKLATMQNDLAIVTEQNRQLIEERNLLQAQLTTATEQNHQLTKKVNEQATIISEHTNTITDLKTDNATLATQKQNFLELLEQREKDIKTEQGRAETNMKDLANLSAQYANIQGQNKTLADQLAKSESMTQAQAEKIEKLIADLAIAQAIPRKTTGNQNAKGKVGNSPKN